MKKVKEFMRSAELKSVLMVLAVCTVLTGLASAAETGTSTTDSSSVISAFESGFNQIKADAMSVIAVAVPVAVSIAAVIFISKKAMSWFKGMAK